MGLLGTFLGRVKTLGSSVLNGARTLGHKIGDIADQAAPVLSRFGLGGIAQAVGTGARAIASLAGNVKAATDRLPSIDQLTMGAPNPNG